MQYLADTITPAEIKRAARAARKELRAAGYTFASIFSAPDANPKLEKSTGLNVASIPLHLAPARLSGFNMCAKASPGCIAACLHTAGNPIYFTGKERARIARTQAFMTNRDAFLIVAAAEILSHVEKCTTPRHKWHGYTPAARPNATSDWPWHRTPVTIAGKRFASLMALFPGVQFYDYTKVSKRITRETMPANYHLTFSLSETNESEAAAVLRAGGNVAAVFNVKRSGPLPLFHDIGGQTAAVIDGDEHDYRPRDVRGVIVGLRAKGDAIGDRSGFVREPDHRFNA